MAVLILLLFIQSTGLLSDQGLVQDHLLHRSDVAPMTLAQIEAAALENNADIRLVEQRVAQVKTGTAMALATEDPTFTYRAWGTPLFSPWNVNQTQHMFMVNQVFPAKGKRELRYELALNAVEVAEAELETVKLDVAASVRSAFYELLRTYDELRLHDEQSVLARQAVASARIKYTVGRVPQQDVLKAQVAVTQLAEHLTMFLQDGDLARARLNTLMGRDPAALLEIAGEYTPVSTLPGVTRLQQIALENRPELKVLKAAIHQSETNVLLTEKNTKPDLMVGGGYMLMPSGGGNRNALMAELSFNLPWLNRSKVDAQIREIQAGAGVQRAEVEKLRAAIFHEIQIAFIRANSAMRLLDLYRHTLRPQAQATLRATSAAYQTDQTDFLNLIDSQNTLLDVEYSYYRALADFDGRTAELERAIGAAIPRNTIAQGEARHEAK